MYPQNALQALGRLYEQVKAATEALEKRHAARLQCQRGCAGCCLDDLEVMGIEAAYILHSHPGFMEQSLPHPVGKCAFLNGAGECRIYESRPLVCRTHGLPLRWTAEDPEQGTVEYRDICPLNEEGEPLELLTSSDCLSLASLDESLARLQIQADGGQLHRVRLRDLFEKE